METLHSRLTTGEQSGGQEHSQQESPLGGPEPKSSSDHCQPQEAGSPKPHGSVQQHKQSRRQPPERKRLRPQRQSVDSDSAIEGKQASSTTTKTTRVSSSSTGGPSPLAASSTQGKQETKEGTPKPKRERKPQRPGKYVCTYCGRACAKPSVLQKHIRSHTGERPYPCAPCGFSFKTKSNLYKHRKSHTHRVKAGLVFGESRSLEGQVTESEDESKQLSSASSSIERQGSLPSLKSHKPPDKAKDHPGGMDDSYAVKKRLAMRLSRGKHGPLDSPDEKTSSLIQGSRGSTESGYFSRSESTEQPQDSPPNTSAKSYAEIILGKYGRLGHLQRMSRHHNQQSSGQEEKHIPFTVPKKQVIDHITKLITINEAVVDTSKIDSVKPRRFSLSRKSSTESQKNVKESVIQSPKAGDYGYKTSGSITMGVPCEKFHHQSLNVEPLSGQTSAAPLLRSHSMPSSASSLDNSSSSATFRPCQSFDERTSSEVQASRRYGILRRQPAIEIPFGGELPKEDYQSSQLFYHDNIAAVPDHKQSQPQPYECEACGTGCKDWEGYKTHKQSVCLAQHPVKISEIAVSHVDSTQHIYQPPRPGASAIRKRRKEESFESDDSSPVSSCLPCPAFTVPSSHSRDEGNIESRRPTLQTFSVIQHTSSFEKQDTLCTDNHGKESAIHSPFHEEYHPGGQKPPQQHTTKPTSRKLVRQTNVQVPEILVTEDPNITESLSEPPFTSKPSEKPEEFQWPQRSPSLAQLPIEKLPPKKKRLRLAEVAQSSGESSFDSISLPRSPSQDSSASYASSRSASFEESNRLDIEMATSVTPLRRSRVPHMLSVPGIHQQREMRRSASEQAPHEPQQGVLMAENRSKSFDYSCLSPERSAVGWRERRKCLLIRHSVVRDEEEVEEKEQSAKPIPNSPIMSSRAGPSVVSSTRTPMSPLSGDSMSCNPTRPQCKDLFSQRKVGQNIQLSGSIEPHLVDIQTTVPLKERAIPVQAGQPPDPSRNSPQHHPMQGPSGAARAHYLTVSTGLKLEIHPPRYSEYSGVRLSPSVHSLPSITCNPELLMPPTSPAIAVRLQADTLTPACAIYTTLSQTMPPRCQGPVATASIPTFEYRSHRDVSLDLTTWSEGGLRSSTSAGNKRMLSPSNSIELQPESQQQQKRVKEEDEARGQGSPSMKASNKADKQGDHPHLPIVFPPVTHVVPSLTSLQSNTCNSWCYLNYIKPNPSTTDERQPSVYSSWSTSSYDPNPPGLSSKTALSLLHCKQRLSPFIYTMCPMSVGPTDPLEVENSRSPCSTEVHLSQTCKEDPAARRDEQHAEDNRSDKGEEEGRAEEAGKDVHSSKYRNLPHVWICDEGSSETSGRTRGRGEEGENSICDCRFHCRTSGAPLERTCLPADCKDSCKHCKFALKTEAPPKHTRSTANKEQHQEAYDTDEGICEDRSMDSDEHAHRQRADREDRRHSAPNSDHTKKGDDGDDEGGEDSRSTAIVSSHLHKRADPAGHASEPKPGPSHLHTVSPEDLHGARQAFLARRPQEPSVSLPSGGGLNPTGPTLGCRVSPTKAVSPRTEPSQPGSPSPGPWGPPTPQRRSPLFSLSSAGCHVSPSPERGLSPTGDLPRGAAGRSRSPACPGGTSAPREDPPLPRDVPTAAALQTSLRAPSVDEPGPAHLAPQPAPPRGARNVLSHLPLHSQQPSRAPSLMIPIGGIHIIQPRATSQYSLGSGPIPAPPNPCPGASGMLEVAAARFSPPERLESLREPGPRGCGCSSPQLLQVTGEKACRGQPGPGSGRGSPPGGFSSREPPSPGKETNTASTLYQGTERVAYPETVQGQTPPSSQTQL